MKIFSFSHTLAIGLLVLVMISCGSSNENRQAMPVSTDTVMVTNQAQTAATQVDMSSLPQAITDFLQQHFPGSTIARIKTGNELGGVEYDITLSDGIEVDFDTKNEWESVDCHVKAVPAALVPSSIADYVKANYQSATIVKIDRKKTGYEVELSNGTEMKFDANGSFLGLDD